MSQSQLDSNLPGTSSLSEAHSVSLESRSSNNNSHQAASTGGTPTTELVPPSTTASVVALVSPDSQNNNRRNPNHPCLVSERVKEHENPLVLDDSTDLSDAHSFEGKILYTRDGSAYIIEGDESNLPSKSLPISPDSVSENSDPGNPPLISAYHVRPKLLQAGGANERVFDENCEPLIQRYKDEAKQAETKVSEKRNEISPELNEIARNLMLASELSASRLLQQVSQNAIAMTASAGGVYVPESLVGCAIHPEGKSPATECPKCDILLSTKIPAQPPAQLSVMHSAATARNACKTLKCPKCNWHYKYQETLEIHMKEKHPDSEGTIHKLRDDTCSQRKRATQIDMTNSTSVLKIPSNFCHVIYGGTQSDKHLNNVQELQQGGSLIDPASLIHSQPPQHTPHPQPPPRPMPQISPESVGKSGGTGRGGGVAEKLRCEVCNYETTVARNLRIHMTSEKHTQNTMLLQRKLALCGGSPYHVLPGEMQTFGFSPVTGLDTASLLGLQRAEGEMGGSEELVNTLYQCCVCVRYCTDSLEELLGHIQADRSAPGPADVSILAGNYYCNLCQYKTHLKANFQLHTKTDKHVQRLMLVNHVREGGPENEWRLRYVNVNNPVQLRCNACNEFFTSSHKLQLHALSGRHNGYQKAFFLLKDESCGQNRRFICILCNYTSRRASMLDHVHSQQHRNALNCIEEEETSDLGESSCWIQVFADSNKNDDELNSEFLSGEADEDSEEEDEWNLDDDEDIMTDAIHCCAWCNYTCRTSADLRDHVKCQHGDGVENMEVNPVKDIDGETPSIPCRLCQADAKALFHNRQQLEDHLIKVHKVSEQAIVKLLPPDSSQQTASPTLSPPASVPADSTTVVDSDLDQVDSTGVSDTLSSGGGLTFPCSVCLVPFNSCEDLYCHQSESGHLELKQTPNGPGYLCWQKACNQYFKTAAAVQVHFREIHGKKPQLTGCISDRHVYKYRCSQCSLAFRTEEKLQEHSIYHLMRASTKCAICGRNFRKIDALRRHVESTHINENSEDTSSRPHSLQAPEGASSDSTTAFCEDRQKDASGRRSASSLTDEDHLNTPALGIIHKLRDTCSQVGGHVRGRRPRICQ